MKTMANSVADIWKIYKSQGIKDILISSILVKQSINLGKTIAQANEFLSSLSKENMVFILCRIKALRESIYYMMVYICRKVDYICLLIT